MVLQKHIKLFRRLLGILARPKSGFRGNLLKFAKAAYLLCSWPVEMLGDLFAARNDGSLSPNQARRILIVKTDQLGDVVFSTLLVTALKRQFPAVQIDYVVRPNARAVLQNNPHIENIFFWNSIALEFLPGRGNLRGLLGKLRQNGRTKLLLQENAYDVVINARAYPPSSNVPLRKIGKELISFDISEQSFLADHWARYSLEANEVENYANLLAPLGISADTVQPPTEFYNYSTNHVLRQVGCYALVSPVSFESDRQWKSEYWAALVSSLTSAGVHAALTGIPSHRDYLQGIASMANGFPNRVHILTDLGLADFASLLKDASIFVGIDSFPAHLAITLQKSAAILIAPDIYFLKGYSQARFAVEARSMLPIVPNVAYFDVQNTSPAAVGAYCIDMLNATVKPE